MTLDDYLMGRVKFEALSKELQKNAEETVEKVNKLLDEFGEERICTSGYRSIEHQKRIYEIKNKARKAAGLPEIKVPLGSKHITAQACDLDDRGGRLFDFCLDNQDILDNIGLWIEDGTDGWVHCQTVPYGSWTEQKSRFFKP